MLQTILKESTGHTLLKTITDSFMTITREHAKSLKEVLGPLIYEVNNPLHCVRCHDRFLEMKNHDEACVIFCDDQCEPCDDWRSEGLRGWMKLCCGVRYAEGKRSYPSDICYTARHTTNPKEVSYFKKTYEEDDYGYAYQFEAPEEPNDEEGLSFDGCNELVNTCREHGCNVQRG